MEGKVFLYSNGTPPRIAFSPDAFTFDLQRFAPTEETGTLKKVETGSTVPSGAVFYFKDGTDTWYSTDASDFTTSNLSGATDIQILGDITLADNVEVNLGATRTEVIKVAGNATLNLGDKNLIVKRTTTNASGTEENATVSGIGWDNSASASAIVVQNGKTFTVNGTTGKIDYTWDPSSSDNLDTIKKARHSAAVQVGEKVGRYNDDLSNTDKATFNMQGGNITSKSTAISMSDNAVVNISGGTTESTKSCGIYYGNNSPGGGEITISGGTLKSGSDSKLPAIQISGNIADGKHNLADGKEEIPAKINITGGTIAFTNNGYNNYTEETESSYFGKDGKPVGNPDAIYAGGNTELTISSGTITSTGTGVELRAGSLNFTGGTVESTASEYKVKDVSSKNTSGGQTFGAAIAIAQHTTDIPLHVTVSGENTKATGQVALAIENPADRKITATGDEPVISAEIDGGTFESKGEGATAIAAKAADSRSSININGTVTFIGTVKDTVADAETTTPTITFGEKADVTVVTVLARDETTGEITQSETSTYDSTSLQYTETWTTTEDGEEVSHTETYPVNDKAWNKSKENPTNKFFYLAANDATSKIAGAKAVLAPKKVSELGSETDSDEILAITTGLTQTQKYEEVIALDLSDTVFTSLFDDESKFTAIDASAIERAASEYDEKTGKPKANATYSDRLKLNIIGNDNITSILGSAGNDTLKAGSAGAVLSGGKGDNLLQGGDGEDTFIHTAGTPADSTANPSVAAAPNHDTIDNYKIADDIVSLTNELPTDLANGISYNNTLSEFVISLGGGAGDSLTFHSASEIKFKRYNGNGDDTYYYRADRVIKNDTEATLGAAFSDKTFNLNRLSSEYVDYSKVAKIDASAVTSAVNITGNTDNTNLIHSAQGGGTVTGGDSGNTLISSATSEVSLMLRGGEGDDSLVGGDSKNTFVYNGGTDSISGYTADDTVRVNGNGLRLAEATVSVGAANEGVANISLGWGGTDNLIFENIGSDVQVKVQQGTGNNYYTYAQQYFAHNKSITLAAGYNVTDDAENVVFNGADDNYKNYETINAAAVKAANGISIVGNDNNNYIIGATTAGGSIWGGEGNDKINVSERGENAKYLFKYTAGKDEIIGFASGDSVDIAPTSITAAKASNSNGKLTLTVKKNSDVLTLRGDEIEKVSLTGGEANYLTKDGYVKETPDGETTGTLKLFASAKGQIDLTDALYAGSNINSVVANSVKSQGVTLTGGEQGGTFTYMANNKKKDGFVYGGGDVTINGYETGRDRIDLGSASLTSFEVTGSGDNKDDVKLTVGTNTISIVEAAGKEVLLRDGASKSSSYKKMVFAANGVLQNKEKNPTLVTISGAAANYPVSQTSIKKIYLTGIDNAGFSVQAGDKNNTQIDASNAGVSVSLSGGAKNDKLIGNTVESANDLFVYSAGKDIIQNFSAGDSISITSGLSESLGSARITAGSNSIKFRFTNKDTLTIKPTKGEKLNGSLTINGTTQTYVKNAIASGANATLTSAFSGTFKTDDSKLAEAVTAVDASNVSKNLTYKGTAASESLTGGSKKTTFKGGGGADILVGGSGKDIFVYTKNETGTTTIADFEFGSGRAGNDKLKIASGTISEISTVTADSKTAIQFAMNSGKNTSNIGWFQVTSGKDNADIDASKVAIKANNTYYWFAKEDITDTESGDILAQAGQLITSDSKISNSDVSSLDILDLNYSTNLVKAGVAVKVANAKPKPTNS